MPAPDLSAAEPSECPIGGMVEPTLALQLERLQTVQHPVLQRLTVAAIFQQLAKPAAGRSRASEAALQACTGHQEQVCLDACSGIQGQYSGCTGVICCGSACTRIQRLRSKDAGSVRNVAEEGRLRRWWWRKQCSSSVCWWQPASGTAAQRRIPCRAPCKQQPVRQPAVLLAMPYPSSLR